VIRVQLPAPLRRLTRTEGIVELEVAAPVTQRKLLDALEVRYPMLRGTTRDQQTQRRRAYVRFFACGEDLSDASPDEPLPAEVASGKELFLVVGALAGG
jgi:sulfur-carrier protein